MSFRIRLLTILILASNGVLASIASAETPESAVSVLQPYVDRCELSGAVALEKATLWISRERDIHTGCLQKPGTPEIGKVSRG